nr:chromosome partitioning protein [Actinomycetota bacterium]
MTGVLTAVGPRWDSRLATTLEAARTLELTRRCADLADLLAAAAAGLGVVAIVSEDLRGLDLTVVSTLRGSGVDVVGASVPGDEGSERRLRQIGITVVVPADAGSAELVDAVLAVSTRAPAATSPDGAPPRAASVAGQPVPVVPAALP